VRNMGFDDANRRASGAVQGRIRQRANKARLLVCAGEEVRHAVHPGDFTSNQSNWQATRVSHLGARQLQKARGISAGIPSVSNDSPLFSGSKPPVCQESDLQASVV